MGSLRQVGGWAAKGAGNRWLCGVNLGAEAAVLEADLADHVRDAADEAVDVRGHGRAR